MGHIFPVPLAFSMLSFAPCARCHRHGAAEGGERVGGEEVFLPILSFFPRCFGFVQWEGSLWHARGCRDSGWALSPPAENLCRAQCLVRHRASGPLPQRRCVAAGLERACRSEVLIVMTPLVSA